MTHDAPNEMKYFVSGGALNSTHSLTYSDPAYQSFLSLNLCFGAIGFWNVIELVLRLVELYGRTRLLLDVLRFFTTNSFNWSNENTVKMYGDMTEQDRKVGVVCA